MLIATGILTQSEMRGVGAGHMKMPIYAVSPSESLMTGRYAETAALIRFAAPL